MIRGALLAMLLCARSGAAGDCSQHGACCFPRTEPRLPTLHETAPRLAAFRALHVDGPLARHVVKHVLAGRAAALGACGSGELRFVVTPAGAVLLEGTGCAADVLRATVFPASDGVTAVALTFAR